MCNFDQTNLKSALFRERGAPVRRSFWNKISSFEQRNEKNKVKADPRSFHFVSVFTIISEAQTNLWSKSKDFVTPVGYD